MKKSDTNLFMIVALYIIPLTGLSIDVYVPSLPNLAEYFKVSSLLAQNTISVYILGLGVSQLICGNIIDRYGRRIPLLIGLFLYLIFAILIILARNIHLVSFLRLMQGISMGFIAVSARSVFVDLYTGDEYYRKASYMTIAYSIGPIVAPAIGGVLEHYWGWQSCFYFLIIYAVIGFILVYLFLPETIKQRSEINITTIAGRYKTMLVHKEYLLNLVSLTMLNSALMLFALVGPFIIQTKLLYSPIVFGQMALLCGLSWFIGNLTNRLFIQKSREHKIRLALKIAGIDLVVMLALALFWFNIYVIVMPICVLLVSASVIFSNLFVHSPTLFPKFAASASAFMAGAFGLFSAFICWLLTDSISTNNQIPLTLGYASLFLIVALCCYATKRVRK